MTLDRHDLIAPCGIDCRLCQRYGRPKAPCPGCRGDDRLKLPSCLNCRIKNCPAIKSGKVAFCFACDAYPCALINRLDKRYRNSYDLSVIANLERIAGAGLDRFVDEQENNWVCMGCGEMLCMHKSACRNCGKIRQVRKQHLI